MNPQLTSPKAYKSTLRHEGSQGSLSQLSNDDDLDDGAYSDEDGYASQSQGLAVSGEGNQPLSPSGSSVSSCQPPSFLASLNLTPSQMEDFLYTEGHFVYLQHKKGLARTSYDLDVVDHTQVGL